MEETEVKKLIFLAWSDRWARSSVFFIILLFVFLSLFLSFLSGIIVLGAYIAGCLVFKTVFSRVPIHRNPLSLLVHNACVYSGAATLHCVVCGDGKCKRHRPTTPAQQPWKSLNVPEEVDEAIEDFLNRTLQEYVYSWYGNLSSDETFVLELRQSIRYAASVLLRKALTLDLAHLITEQLIPAGLGHLDDYLSCVRLAGRDCKPVELAAVQYLGSRLHPAATSRAHELQYLRCLTELILPDLLANNQLKGSFSVLVRELLAGWVLLPLADVLADPAIINSLLILLLSKHQLTEYPDKPGNTVEFLARFASNPPATNESALRVDMASVLKDQDLLYSFMQFLKAEGCVNMLQFCLDVEEFNRKMLTPDLSPGDLTDLHKEAWDLFSVYFSQESPDCLHFPSKLVEAMRDIVSGTSSSIVKLRTSPPLFQAYESAYSQLEGRLCPLFHQSSVFYTYLCGRRQADGFSRSGGRASRRWVDVGVGARITSRLHKIKGALRAAHPIEGSTFESDNALDLAETEFAEDLPLSSSSHRDLSAWRVNIPSVDNKMDASNKATPVFHISVQRIDVGQDEDPDLCHWSVERRYNDFYVLDSKLVEFHGEFHDAQLPPKRLLFGPRGLEFMREKRQVFEQYLQVLLSKASLRGSDLLHGFLQARGEFVPGAGMDGISRMIRRSVPLKLRKERGQHLEPFLAAFLQATETSKPKSSKYEWQDVNAVKPSRVRCLTNTVFRDNLGVRAHDQTGAQYSRTLSIQGLFDSLLYLLVRVFGAGQALVCFTLAVRSVCQHTLDTLARYYLHRKLRKLMAAPRLAHLVNLLQGAIFNPRSPPLSAAEQLQRAALAQAKLEAVLPSLAARLIGPSYKEGVATVFQAVQIPALNKQLVYTLLDIVAVQLYPELDNAVISPQLPEK